MLDRGIDLLDYYRGKISMRRMVLLVVHDRGRMKRLDLALHGLDWSRPWEETNHQMALVWGQLQVLTRVAWAGLSLKGDPPKYVPYPTPAAKAETVRELKPRRDPRKMSYLDRFAPPSSKKHLKLVKGAAESA